MALIVHVSVFVLLLAHLIVMAQLVVVIIVVVAHLFVVDGSTTLAPLTLTALLDSIVPSYKSDPKQDYLRERTHQTHMGQDRNLAKE